MKKALILMTRVPIPGKTKTRLNTIYTKEQCAKLHMCFLKDIFNMYEDLKEEVDIYLTYTEKNKFHILEPIIPNYIKTFPQCEGALGDKMKNAINHVLNMGYEKVVLTGCDIPHMQVEDIHNSYELLENNDIVLGPTTDGGYYLIGMKKNHNIIFDTDLKWGNKSVLEGTIGLCNKNGIKLEIGKKYTDIDTSEDIDMVYSQILNNKLKLIPKNTFKFIASNRMEEKYA